MNSIAHLSRRLGLTLIAIAIAFTGALTIGTEHALADWCATTDAGSLAFTAIDSGNTAAACEAAGDTVVTDSQKDQIEEDPFGGLLPTINPASDFPAGWFNSLGACLILPNSSGVNNRIQDVYIWRAVELGVQIAYDIGSNEITGITGAIIGVILGVVKVPTFIIEWKYDVQDECQEILERNTIQAIAAALGTHSTNLTTHSTNLTTQTDELDAALGTHSTNLNTHAAQTAADQDQNLRLYVEDHLYTCTPTISLLLTDGPGLLALAVLVVEDLVFWAGEEGMDIGDAEEYITMAEDELIAGETRNAFLNLCGAYRQMIWNPPFLTTGGPFVVAPPPGPPRRP